MRHDYCLILLIILTVFSKILISKVYDIELNSDYGSKIKNPHLSPTESKNSYSDNSRNIIHVLSPAKIDTRDNVDKFEGVVIHHHERNRIIDDGVQLNFSNEPKPKKLTKIEEHIPNGLYRTIPLKRRGKKIESLNNQRQQISFDQKDVQKVKNTSGEGMFIYLEWPHPSSQFALLNYRSLESYLYHYPAASFRCILFAPVYALNYKFADALSVQQFQKYQKRGYDIQFELYHSQSDRKLWRRNTQGSVDYFSKEHEEKTRTLYPGLKYFHRWSGSYIEAGLNFGKFRMMRSSILSFELRLFGLLCRLWETGGILSDYTTLLIAPLKKRGFTFIDTPVSPPQRRSLHSSISDKGNTVKESLEMQKKKMFQKKGAASSTSHKLPTSLRTETQLQQPQPTSWTATQNTSLFAYFAPKDPLLRCILSSFDDALDHLCDRTCLEARFETCHSRVQHASQLREIVQDEKQSNTIHELESSIDLVEMEYRSDGVKSVVWLGTSATSGKWSITLPYPVPLIPARWPSTMLHCPRRLIEATVKSCSFFKPAVHAKQPPFFAQVHDTPLVDEKLSDLEAAATRCSPSLFIAGAMKSASTYLFNVLTSHPQILRPLEGSGFKEAGAYSLKNNRGYIGELGKAKVHRFSFIDPTANIQFLSKNNDSSEETLVGEPFVSVDGSVIYMFEAASTPFKILHDSPFAVIVFVLREPVQRTWSDFRYLAHNYVPHKVSFAKATLKNAMLLNSSDCLGGSVLAASLSVALDTGIEGDALNRGKHTLYPSDLFYHRTCGASAVDPNEIVKKSLYFFMVRHWRAAFGPSSILVIDSAQLRSPELAHRQVQRVVSFANLCPYQFGSKLLAKPANVDKRAGGDIPEKLRIDVRSRSVLGEFFEPFDRALYALIGEEFGWKLEREAALKEPRQASSPLQ